MTDEISFNPYAVLGVPNTATTAEIRTKFRKRALECHPDKVSDSIPEKEKEEKSEEFQQVRRSYEILSDETRRSQWDTKARARPMGAGGGGGGGFGKTNGFYTGNGWPDDFEEILRAAQSTFASTFFMDDAFPPHPASFFFPWSAPAGAPPHTPPHANGSGSRSSFDRRSQPPSRSETPKQHDDVPPKFSRGYFRDSQPRHNYYPMPEEIIDDRHKSRAAPPPPPPPPPPHSRRGPPPFEPMFMHEMEMEDPGGTRMPRRPYPEMYERGNGVDPGSSGYGAPRMYNHSRPERYPWRPPMRQPYGVYPEPGPVDDVEMPFFAPPPPPPPPPSFPSSRSRSHPPHPPMRPHLDRRRTDFPPPPPPAGPPREAPMSSGKRYSYSGPPGYR